MELESCSCCNVKWNLAVAVSRQPASQLQNLDVENFTFDCDTVFDMDQWHHDQYPTHFNTAFGVWVGHHHPFSFASKGRHPALFKPQITVAICCQGDLTTSYSHPPTVRLYGSWFTLSTALIKKKKKSSGVVWVWLVEKKNQNIDDTSTNPVSAVRAICVLFKIFCLSPTLHKNAGLDVLFRCIFF